ncbi:MAG: deoxyribose-phosphate aldolase [Brooklawnia sp.]|jgi:deoxyribose-phosphate aldolase
MTQMTVRQVAGLIDHSLLQPQMTRADIDEGCEVAVKYGAATVCVKGYDTEYCAEKLAGTGVGIATVTGFPHGDATIESKVFETRDAVAKGATEIDVVIAIGLARSGMWDYIEDEIRQVNEACNGVPLKVIFENAYLTKEEIAKLCEICTRVGVAFVKTSTGYAPSGATMEDLVLMRTETAQPIEVKAAGGVRDLDQMMEMYQAGITRFGTRSTAEIVAEAEARGWPAE